MQSLPRGSDAPSQASFRAGCRATGGSGVRRAGRKSKQPARLGEGVVSARVETAPTGSEAVGGAQTRRGRHGRGSRTRGGVRLPGHLHAGGGILPRRGWCTSILTMSRPSQPNLPESAAPPRARRPQGLPQRSSRRDKARGATNYPSARQQRPRPSPLRLERPRQSSPDLRTSPRGPHPSARCTGRRPRRSRRTSLP